MTNSAATSRAGQGASATRPARCPEASALQVAGPSMPKPVAPVAPRRGCDPVINPSATMTKERVLIVDDPPLFRDGLRRFILAQPNLTCCGEADSCKTAFDAARQHRPDLLTLDLRLHRVDAMELITPLLAEQPHLRILVLS